MRNSWVACIAVVAACGTVLAQSPEEGASRESHMLIKLQPKSRPAPNADGCWPSERIIYRDELAGFEVWRMTDDPALDWHRYYDCQPWSPDGSTMVFISSRPGGRDIWLMDADGHNIRPLPIPEQVGTPRAPLWSLDGTEVYVGGNNLAAINVTTGESRMITQHEEEGWSDPDLSPDGKWIVYGQWGRSCWLSSVDGRVHIPLLIKDGIDAQRFASADGRTVVCNDDGDTKMWLIRWDPEHGAVDRKLLVDGRFSHPDRMPDFSAIFFVRWDREKGLRVEGVDMDGTSLGTVVKAPFCHLSISHDGTLVVGDRGYAGRHEPWCGVARLDNASYEPVCYHDSIFVASSGSGHPAAQSTHPHPYFSPDDTKFVFNSGLTWTNSEMLVCVWRHPDAPQNVALAEGRLTWDPPERRLELRGYNVYGSAEGATDYRLLTPEPLQDRSSPINARDTWYVVTAVEHSGLESDPVTEVSNAGARELQCKIDVLAPPAPADLTTEPLGRYEAAIAWTSPETSDIHHFAIYRSQDPDFEPSNRTIVGTPLPPLTQYRDWGLDPGVTYHYRVTAVDRWWNESEAAAAILTMPDAISQTVTLEAEDGALGKGMKVVADEEASGGKSMESLEGDNGVATYTCELARTGQYVIWGRACGPNGTSDSFFVSVDAGPEALWDVSNTGYRWDRVADRKHEAPTYHQLAEGMHTITVRRRETGARLDMLIITDDLRTEPSG